MNKATEKPPHLFLLAVVIIFYNFKKVQMSNEQMDIAHFILKGNEKNDLKSTICVIT